MHVFTSFCSVYTNMANIFPIANPTPTCQPYNMIQSIGLQNQANRNWLSIVIEMNEIPSILPCLFTQIQLKLTLTKQAASQPWNIRLCAGRACTLLCECVCVVVCAGINNALPTNQQQPIIVTTVTAIRVKVWQQQHQLVAFLLYNFSVNCCKRYIFNRFCLVSVILCILLFFPNAQVSARFTWCFRARKHGTAHWHQDKIQIYCRYSINQRRKNVWIALSVRTTVDTLHSRASRLWR